MNDTNPRNPWIAAILTFPAPGLGQLYCGDLRRALILASFALLLNPVLLMVLIKSGFGVKSIVLCQIVEWIVGLVILVDAWLLAKRSSPDYRLKEVNRTGIYWMFAVFTLLGGVSAGLGSAFFVKDIFQAYKIPTSSMSPTLNPGDQLMVRKGVFLKEDPFRGDVVVFPAPENRERTYIKRVIGLPGDTVEMKDGALWINGKALLEKEGKEINGEAEYSISAKKPVPDFGPVTVPDYSVFVLGDNRSNSHDSRSFGPIAINSISGKAIHRHWPPQRSGSL